ncbi:DUF4136 domain-containing protein [Zeaxanthinibacter sp. PT1]|uniref:DUF4136 domain-containing protein n=1 Tax=Zeaxanthinibacter TaxID=561554 RepID=UPI00234919EC|nr:DUF4136 domain-containing protein [Zeaxanthinibacter sp. PT1]MDC6352656.1 DUF4136 domain-containing protein [Zeaxanthinibacter sp. PT1]
MRLLSVVILGITLFGLSSCSGVRVRHDYDKTTDFANYTTYNYPEVMTTGLSELDEKRLLSAVDSAMQAKGFKFSEEPDFLLHIYSRDYQAAPRNTVGVGVGGTGRNVGGGVNIGLPIGNNKIEREISFDFVDFHNNTLFWQAVATDSFKERSSPQQREEAFHQMVQKVFAKYPPKRAY